MIAGLAGATALLGISASLSRIYGVTLFATNLAGIFFCVGRARRSASERRGWTLLAASLVASLLGNVVITRRPSFTEESTSLDSVYFAISIAMALLQMWAIVSWPWREASRGQRAIHLVGSALFGSSIFLLLWIIGIWNVESSAVHGLRVWQLAFAARLAIAGGSITYFLSADPRRFFGPLGWLLVGISSLVITVFVFSPAGKPYTPLLSVSLLAPYSLVAAALLGGPVDGSASRPALRLPVADAVLHLPFMLSGVLLGLGYLKNRQPLTWPLVTFIVVAALLVLHQLLLLRELRRSNSLLERRVEERTQKLERMQELALRTEKMNTVATLGAGIVHDLNNLLGAVVGSAEMARWDLSRGRAASRDDIERIAEAAEKAASLSGRLMRFGRNRTAADAAPGKELALAVREAEELLRILLPSGIRLHIEIQPPRRRVVVDPAVVEQILVNLVSNARDALGAEGTIRLRLAEDDLTGAAVLEVCDDGPGIPKEIAETIFEPFVTTKPEGVGTGLGLASVRALMASLHGTVELIPAVGRGAAFRLSFPGDDPSRNQTAGQAG